MLEQDVDPTAIRSSSVEGVGWAPGLVDTLACPACHTRGLALKPGPSCPRCGWAGTVTDGILDFVGTAQLLSEQEAELSAQEHAVGEYYENEEKLSCHWDRMSAEKLPELLGRPSGVVLDLGCGTGSAGAALKRSGARVIGADLAVPCLRVAARRLDGVVRCDAARLPFADGTFDAIVSRGALHHMQDAPAVLRDAARVLKPGGRALFLDPRAFSWLEPVKQMIRRRDASFTDDHHAFEVKEYARLIGEAFEVEEVSTHYPLAILVTVGLDLFPLPRMLPKRLAAAGLLRLDEAFTRTPLRAAGHLIAVRARRRE